MPHAIRLFFDCEGEGIPEPGDIRGFASNLFERGVETDEGHHAPFKPFTVGRPISLGGRTWSLDVTTASDALAVLVGKRMVPGTPVFLGPLSGVVSARPVTIAHRPWSDLAHVPPVTGIQFSFDTPVVFRKQGGQHPEPTPPLIFGHLRRRWRNLDPPTAPDVSFRDISFRLDLDGARVILRSPGPRDPETRRPVGRIVAGFVGTASVEIVGATPAEREALGALAQAAPFLGVGSSTTSGFGATSVLALWADD